MRLNNNKEEPLTPICTTENIPLFVMYIKSELSNDHKDRLDKHLQNCIDCKMNLAYVKEILQFKHPISIDEKTLLLKCLTDPLFYYFISNVKKEVLNDVKNLLQETKIDDSKIKNIINKAPTTNIKQPNKIDEHKTIYQKNTYSYLMLATSMAVFLMLGSFIILGLSIKYPALQAYLPFSKQFGAKNSKDLTSNLIINNKENNLYQQLDSAIDEYLNNKENSERAEAIAKDIKLRYEDNYGIDLVKYYKSVPDSAIEKLKPLRSKMFSLINQPNGDNYQQRLDESIDLEKQLISLGDIVETQRIKLLIAKIYARTYKSEVAKPILVEGIRITEEKNYLYLKAYFLLWEAKNASVKDNFSQTEKSFLATLEIGKKLMVSDLIINPTISLMALYQQYNKDQKALDLAQTTLKDTNFNINLESIISFKQIAGLSAFKLGYFELSNSYLTDAIEMSKKANISYLVANSYTFLGLTLAESRNFADSEQAYLNAQTAIMQIKEESIRLDALSILFGYQAKSKLSAGNFQQAANLYKETLAINKQLGISHNLEIAQLNEGLAMALTNLGLDKESKTHLAIASQHKKLADNNYERSNCLLSYVPVKCN